MLLQSHNVATRLHLSEAAVNRMAEDGTIPVIVLPNGARRFDERELLLWLRSLQHHRTCIAHTDPRMIQEHNPEGNDHANV